MKVSVPWGLGHVAASSSPGLCYNMHRHLGLSLQLELTEVWPQSCPVSVILMGSVGLSSCLALFGDPEEKRFDWAKSHPWQEEALSTVFGGCPDPAK